MAAANINVIAGRLELGRGDRRTIETCLLDPENSEWASVAEQVTVVVPFGKVDPDSGEQVGVPTPEQLSVAVANPAGAGYAYA